MVVAGIALGFVVTPALFALVAVGLADGVLAALFASGRIGPLASRDAADPVPRAASSRTPRTTPTRARTETRPHKRERRPLGRRPVRLPGA